MFIICLGNFSEVKTEADSSDVTECSRDKKPSELLVCSTAKWFYPGHDNYCPFK